MSFVERYLSDVGLQSHDLMKITLGKLLLRRYDTTYDADFATSLAVSVANYLFCDQATNTDAQSFAEKNRELIESKAKELSTDDALCRALTCAVYNFCYGKYVESGGKVGLLLHPFLGYVRALQRVMSGKEPVSFLDSSKVGQENVLPLLTLLRLGLYRPLPYTPDSKVMMDEIVSFGRQTGYLCSR
jgi:hypothetical protein